MKLINEIGHIYGDLTVLSQAKSHIQPNGRPKVQWLCQCACGNQTVVLGDSLRNGRTKSCGKCNRRLRNAEIFSDNKTNELIGKIYGYLKVLEPSGYEQDITTGKRRRLVKCECLLCGKIIEVRTNRLKTGCTFTCGNHNQSRGEEYVELFLKNQQYQYKKEFIFQNLKDVNPLRFDFAIYKNNKIYCIEINGNQHYSIDNGWYNSDIIKHDKMKQEYCLNNNIPLLILNYSSGQAKTNFKDWGRIIKNFLLEE